MTRTRVKICGIRRAEDAQLAVELGVDAIGFIMWQRSPRSITPHEAAVIAAALPPFVARVGVFVNELPDTIAQMVSALGLDVVQLHGDEQVDRYRPVPARLMKAVTLQHDADVERALAVPADVGLLIDATDRERRGGTGQQANWELAARVASRRPVILAGGLSARNVGEAIRDVKPSGIDVSSGVETEPGVKDAGKMRALFEAVREGDRARAKEES